jgi:hypothetical protein
MTREKIESTLIVRFHHKLKSDFKKKCNEKGLSMNKALVQLAKKYLNEP